MQEIRVAPPGCPALSPAHATVHARALHRACLIVGGLETLAHRLDVAPAELERWLRAEQPPPERVFLQTVELLLLYASDAGGRPT